MVATYDDYEDYLEELARFSFTKPQYIRLPPGSKNPIEDALHVRDQVYLILLMFYLSCLVKPEVNISPCPDIPSHIKSADPSNWPVIKALEKTGEKRLDSRGVLDCQILHKSQSKLAAGQ